MMGQVNVCLACGQDQTHVMAGSTAPRFHPGLPCLIRVPKVGTLAGEPVFARKWRTPPPYSGRCKSLRCNGFSHGSRRSAASGRVSRSWV